MAYLTIKKSKVARRGVALLTLPVCQILGPTNISGTAEDTNLKFCKWVESKGPDTKQKNAKLVKTECARATSRSRDI